MTGTPKSASRGALFQPCAVREVEVGLTTPVPELTGLQPYARALLLVRFEGDPIGFVEAPVVSGRVAARELERLILARFDDDLVRRVIARRLTGATHKTAPQRPPRVTAIVCTRNRPEDLAGCLSSLTQVQYPTLEILVVDNAPSDDRSEQVVRRFGDTVRYIREMTPGLSRARRRGIAESRADLIAFVDDDVRVHPACIGAIVEAFDEHDVMVVLGLVAPAEIETLAQEEFERHGGFGRGFTRRWIRRRRHGAIRPSLVNTGALGIGANMTFRRGVFDEVGSFDVALGAGTRSDGGEDLDLMFRVLRAGHSIVYEPSAIVWHRHRRTPDEVRKQCEGWSRGMGAYLARSWSRYPDVRRAIATLAVQLLVYYSRRMAQSLFDPNLRIALTTAEFRGVLTGPFRYAQASKRRDHPQDEREPSTAWLPAPGRDRGIGALQISLDEPLPSSIDNPNGDDLVELVVFRRHRELVRVPLVAGGCAVSSRRAAEAIVAAARLDQLDPDHIARAAVREAFSRRALEPADAPV